MQVKTPHPRFRTWNILNLGFIGLLLLLFSCYWYSFRSGDVAEPENDEGDDQTPTSISVFVLMGKTGAGKSSFIKLLNGASPFGEQPVVYGGINSGTQKPAVYLTRVGKRKVFLLDTPGFDDSTRDNLEVLSEIMSQLYLLALQPNEFSMQGVVFLHDMNEVRFGGSQKKTLGILKALVGEAHLGNVIVGSTFWDKSKLQQQEKRERELMDQHWDGIYKTMRLPHKDRNAAVAIINELFKREPALLLAQEEMLKPPHTVEATTVGKLAVPEGLLELKNLQREQEERERAFEVETKRQEALLQEQIRDTRQKFKAQEAQSLEREESQMLRQADEMKKLEQKLRREFKNENQRWKEEARQENRKREMEEKVRKEEERAVMKLGEDLRKRLVKMNRVREEKARRDAEEQKRIKITLKNFKKTPQLTQFKGLFKTIVTWFHH